MSYDRDAVTTTVAITMVDQALAYTGAGWEIFPLRGKTPSIPKAAGGNGVRDATADPAQVLAWWAEMPRANIGGRVPAGLVVIDTDPRHDGERHLLELAEMDGGLPATMAVLSGRGDGGRHRYFIHPGGELTSAQLPEGVDLKTNRGYCVLPPSIHPDSGEPYRWDDSMPLVPMFMPAWLVMRLRPKPRPARPTALEEEVPNGVRNFDGDSIADWFTAAHTWADVLEPHGWTEIGTDRWRHPTATAPVSATVRHGLLFVYSTSTPFEITEPDHPHGYTRFRAWALLNHHDDLSAAARAARALRGGT